MTSPAILKHTDNLIVPVLQPWQQENAFARYTISYLCDRVLFIAVLRGPIGSKCLA